MYLLVDLDGSYLTTRTYSVALHNHTRTVFYCRTNKTDLRHKILNDIFLSRKYLLLC